MDRDCFNLVIRKFMFDDIQAAQKTKQLIAKHYMDMKFWMSCTTRGGTPTSCAARPGPPLVVSHHRPMPTVL
ncbi:hypothetical protein ZWY2020_003305 [Hordeum vulgare]|nr:hypothetical protein ZWY2020_003305 [Hordeum vulgare]